MLVSVVWKPTFIYHIGERFTYFDLAYRPITNHNHCHALTIQYYEVLRHFMVVTEYIGSRQVVLLPYKLIEFNFENALRYRAILEPVLLDRTLASCFDAITRLHITPEIYSLKKYQESADTSNGVGSTNTTSTQPKPKINRYELTLESNPKHNWGSTWGGIGIHLRLKTGANVPLWFKTSVADRGQELNKIAFPIEITDPEVINLGTDPANIDMVKVAWSEDNGNDSWAFAGIRIRYALEGQVGFVGTIIDEHGDPENPELKRFDNGENLLWTKDVSIASPTPSPTSDPQLPTKTSLEKSPLIVLSKIEDAICEKKLIAHLNNNKVYYSRAIWLLQDPSERVMMLNHMLPGLINDIDTTPIAVSGNHLAFPYNAEPTKEEEDRERERLKKYPPSKSITSIPTRGLFAETQLSHCNACEVRDVTRFWQWDESPCEKPPTIEGITPGPRGQTPNVETTTLPSPIVQIMQPPAAPDPVGLAAALNLLGQPNIFRDMSGMKELQELLSGLSSGSVDLAKAQLLANEAQQKLGSQMHTSLFGGKGSSQSPEERYDNLQVAKEFAKSAEELGIDDETKGEMSRDIVEGGGGLSSIPGIIAQTVMGAKPGGGGLVGVGAAIGEKALGVVDGEIKKLFEAGNFSISGPEGAAVILRDTDPEDYTPPGPVQDNLHHIIIRLNDLARKGPGDGLKGQLEIYWIDNCRLTTVKGTGPQAQSKRSIWFKKGITVLGSGTAGNAIDQAQITLDIVKFGVDNKINPPQVLAAMKISISIAPKTALGTPSFGQFLIQLDPSTNDDYDIENNNVGPRAFIARKIPRP